MTYRTRSVGGAGTSVWLRLIALLAVIGLVAAACGDDGTATDDERPGGGPVVDEGDPVYGGSVTVGLEAESNSFLPGESALGIAGTTIAHHIYDPLIILNEDGENIPYLAESLEANDDVTEWTVRLRPGVQFHDGTPLNAQALKDAFDEYLFVEGSNTQGPLMTAGVTGMRVDDELTVTYELSSANAAFPDLLRGSVGWPFSVEAARAAGPDAGARPVGTGPFVFDSWERDSQLVVVRNENYWRSDDNGNQLPYLDRIVFRPIPDEETRVAALATGDVDIMHTLRGSHIKQVIAMEEEGGYVQYLMTGNESGVSIINTTVPPLDDRRIRQAMGYAGDSEAVARVLGDDGLVDNTTQWFSSDSPWWSQRVAEGYPGGLERDVERARELVQEYVNDPNRSDGQPVGTPPRFTYNCPPDPSLIEVAQLVQQLWGEAGIEVELNQLEQAAHIQVALAGDYEVNCWRQGGDSDPYTVLSNAHGSLDNPLNFTNFVHPGIDEQLEILRTSTDFDTRYDAVEQIHLILNEEMPYTWGVGTATTVGAREQVRNIAGWTLPDGSLGRGTPNGLIRLVEAWLDS